MTLDNNALETLSINEVKNSIVMCDYLSQFITDNDKEPSWDGTVYIYDDKNKTKDKLKGRMPVQIKGKECNDFSKEDISYTMSTVDLRNYLYDGGCILFVVYIGDSGLKKKIYYAELTPIKLRQLLNGAKNQNSKVVHLKPFPNDNYKKATIFLNCLQNCQKQASVLDNKLLSLKELKEQKILENIVIPFSGVGIKDPQMALVSNDVYVYAKVKGCSIYQPIDMKPEDMFIQETVNNEVTIDEKVFYTKYNVIKNANGVVYRFGESITMKFIISENIYQIKYKNSFKIRVLAHDLDFILTALDKGSFQVNGINFPISYNTVNFENFDIEGLKETLVYLKKIVNLFNLLGCSEDINLKDLDAESCRNLNYLIVAFLDKQPVCNLGNDLPSICSMKVGNLKFVFYFKKCDDINKGKYEILDFFKTDLYVTYNGRNGETLPISQFCLFNTNDFLTINNIDFDVMFPSFQKIKHHYDTFNQANYFLLNLLSACDLAEGTRKKKILNTCDKFSEWILEAPDNELDYNIKMLNRLQVIKRMRTLSTDEESILYNMIINLNTKEEIRIGAYLLLGNQQAAEIHFTRLSEEEKKNFSNHPIHHYWKHENTADR